MGRDDDIGGSHSGGKAGDDPGDALKDLNPEIEPDTKEGKRAAGGIPDDVKPGKRTTIGQDEDQGAGSDVPGSTAGD